MMIKKDEKLNSYFRKLIKSGWNSGKIVKKTFRKERYVVLQGDDADSVHLITSGTARCFITEPNGREYILELLGEGELIGELELLTQEPYTCTVQTVTELSAYKFRPQLFHEIIDAGGELTMLIMKQLAHRLRRTAGRASYQQIYPIEYAILKFLSSVEEKEIHISKTDLANYLAIPVRSLNRGLNALVSVGIIRLSGNTVVVQSEDRLLSRLRDYHF